MLLSYYHSDFWQIILKHNIIELSIKLSDTIYNSTIRSNCMLAISLMTYNTKLFDYLLKNNVIDLLIENCKLSEIDLDVQLYSTQALVHFALNEKSIDILIDKGIMDLFNHFDHNPKLKGDKKQ